MRGIDRFVSKKTKQEATMDRFRKLAKKAESKKDIRELEIALLRPAPIPKYKGLKVGFSEFKKRSIRFSFPSYTYIKRMEPYFKINKFKEYNSHDVDMLIELVNLLDSGRIVWNRKKKKFYIKIQDHKMRI